MTTDEARVILDSGRTTFDYLMGRVLKFAFDGDSLNLALYNRDNGEDIGSMIIDSIRDENAPDNDPNNETIRFIHVRGREEAANELDS